MRWLKSPARRSPRLPRPLQRPQQHHRHRLRPNRWIYPSRCRPFRHPGLSRSPCQGLSQNPCRSQRRNPFQSLFPNQSQNPFRSQFLNPCRSPFPNQSLGISRVDGDQINRSQVRHLRGLCLGPILDWGMRCAILAPHRQRHQPGPTPKPAPAAQPGPRAVDAAAVKRALGSEIGRQLKPRWKAPTGQDVDQLVTILSWDLNKDGSLAGEPRFVSQSGVNASNAAQAAVHKENAIKAVRAAAPFKLPVEHYSYWKSVVSFRFDKRLSQ
jgi:hypothetical protein